MKKKEGDFVENLQENYKREIVLSDIEKEDADNVRDIVRQLERVFFSVKNTEYKVAILYRKYMCVIKRDESIECYISTSPLVSNQTDRRLYINVDLELLYKKMNDSLLLNIKDMRYGIMRILNKNYSSHERKLRSLLENGDMLLDRTRKAHDMKEKYDSYLQNLQNILKTNNESENRVINKMKNNNSRGPVGRGLVKELSAIQKTKEDIFSTIDELNAKRETSVLLLDKIMFDNVVMLDAILRNNRELKKIEK